MKAMILAAGLGTRFKPWTDHHPKALVPINGKTLLERNILYLHSFGITEIMVNIHHFADQIIEAIETNDGWGSKITISDESDAVLETGGGLKKAGWFFNDGVFVVINADILTDLNLESIISFHYKHTPLATLAVTNRPSSRYFLFNEGDQLCGWRNIKTGEERMAGHTEPLNEKAFSGIHVLSPEIFPLMHQQGKFSIVNVYLELAATHRILGFDHSGSAFVDVGKPEAVALAESLFS